MNIISFHYIISIKINSVGFSVAWIVIVFNKLKLTSQGEGKKKPN